MAITRISQSSVKEGLEKYTSFYGGLSGALFGQYESIQTITVGAGGQAAIEFTSIPQTYQHLQVRVLARSSVNSTVDALKMNLNLDSGANYARHGIVGNGTSASAFGVANTNNDVPGDITGATAPASVFGVSVIDILDYTSTTKVKIVRTMNGREQNANDTSGTVGIYSALWASTSAITSIRLTTFNNNNFAQHTTAALYGIKVTN